VKVNIQFFDKKSKMMRSISDDGLAFFIGGMNGKETENNNMAQSKCNE